MQLQPLATCFQTKITQITACYIGTSATCSPYRVPKQHPNSSAFYHLTPMSSSGIDLGMQSIDTSLLARIIRVMTKTAEQATNADSISASKPSDDAPMSEEVGTVSNNEGKGENSSRSWLRRPRKEKMSTDCLLIRSGPSYCDYSTTNGKLFGRFAVARMPDLLVQRKFDRHVVVKASRRGVPPSTLPQQGFSVNQIYDAYSGAFSSL